MSFYLSGFLFTLKLRTLNPKIVTTQSNSVFDSTNDSSYLILGLACLFLFLRNRVGDWFYLVLGRVGGITLPSSPLDLCGRTDSRGDNVPRRNTDPRLGEIPRKEVRESRAGRGGWKGAHWLIPPAPALHTSWLLFSLLPDSCSLPLCLMVLALSMHGTFPQWGRDESPRCWLSLLLPSTFRFPPRLSHAALPQPLRLKNLQHARKVDTLPPVAWGVGGESGNKPLALSPFCSLITVLINAR